MSSNGAGSGIGFGRNARRAIVAVALVVVLTASYASVARGAGGSSALPRTDSAYDGTSYVLTESNVAFTGDVASDFAGDQIYHNANTTPWDGSNFTNIYAAYNSTQLFLGINGTVSGNSLMIFLSNETNSPYGTTNITGLAAWSGHDINFTSPINYIAAVYVGGLNTETSGAFAARITSPVSLSDTSSETSTDIPNNWVVSASGFELSINWSGIFPSGFDGAAGLQFSAFIAGGSQYVGMGAPFSQEGAYGSGDQPFFLVNDTFSIVAPDVVQPTHVLTNQNVAFTGDVVSDFAGDLLYYNYNATPWGADNNITGLYAAYNQTDLFLGLNAVADTNSIMFFIANETQSGLGTTNISSLTLWGGRDFNFTYPINYEAAVYSGGVNSGFSGQTAGRVTSAVSASDTTDQTYVLINNTWDFGSDGYELELPWTGLFPSGLEGPAGLEISAFVVGGGGPCTGMGAPYLQIGIYNDCSASGNFEVNDTISILAPYLNVPSSVAPPTVPISLDIIFNDHQPFYESIDSTTSYLPWTVVHLEEYAEQAIIAGEAPTVNVTYSLSGSLLYQIEAIGAGYYNNSYLQTALIPSSQWSNTVYTEISQHGDSFLESIVDSPDWNSTTVAQAIEFDLAFNTPLWVYSAAPAAAHLYDTLFGLEQSQLASGVTMNTTDLTDALVEFFLWSASYPIISGQLGMQFANSTMWSLYNQSSFSISDLRTIEGFYPVEARLTLSAFAADRMLNDGGGGNVELLTTAFDHPILPLLELNNWTGETGDQVVKGVWTNDTIAQLNIGRQLYYEAFGQYPTGLWSSEQAVSEATVPLINQTGYSWTSSSQDTLAEAGIAVPSGSTPTAQEMENLYTPYRVLGPTDTDANSTVMVFRDDTVSNAWGFDYGATAETDGSWAAVDEFMSYLRNIEVTIPNSDHNNTLVTVALDGENWMFESPFPEDAVPFLQDLYTALAQNSSWVVTTTVQQYMASHPDLPTLSNLPIGSWNPEPSGPGINQYLGQWAGHGPQDSTWEQLTLVRSEVAAYGQTNGLTQPENLTQISPYNNFPDLSAWNATTLEGKYTEAWTAIYLAEGSDITFTFDPDDESLSSQNAFVFENEFRSDLSDALTVLGLPLTPFLASSYVPPVTPTVWGTNASDTPVLTGSLYTTQSYSTGTGYSISNNDAWTGAYEEQTGYVTSTSGTIGQAYYSFDADNLYFSVGVNGPTSAYQAPSFYTPATDDLDVFFSGPNPGSGNLESLAVPDAAYTQGTTEFGFAATSEATIEGSSVTPTGTASMELFQTSGPNGTWTYDSATAGDAFVGGMLQLEVPLRSLGMVPGDSVEFMIAAVDAATGDVVSFVGPMSVTVPASLAVLTPISSIHNPAPSDGTGNYTYPTASTGPSTNPNPDYPPGSVDMEWLNVSDNPYTVQFNITFGSLSNVFAGGDGFTQPIIDIYIHEPGVAGSTAGLPGTQIDLASVSAWAWAIQASGYSSNNYVESSTGVAYPTDIVVGTNYVGTNISQPDRTVSIDVPTALIGTGITSYTYTIVAGFQDGYATNGWDTVNVGPATAYQGGGANNTMAPYVFSYIAPAVVGSNPALTQQDLLNNYTTSHFATLVGISLPLLTVSTSSVASLGASTIVNASADPEGFYAFGTELYETSSPDGVTWSTPQAIATLPWVPQGLAASGGSAPGLLAWNGTSVVFLDTATGAFTNWSASGPIESAAVTYFDGTYLLATDIAGSVSVGPPGGFALGTDSLAVTAVGIGSAGSDAFLAYATASAVAVIELYPSLTPGDDYVDFGTQTILSAAVPSGSTVPSLALGVAPNDGVLVAVDLVNASGSNIFLLSPTASGSATGTLTEITTDGADFSPSILIGGTAPNYDGYVGFTSKAGVGNVFFLPTSAGTVQTPPTLTSAPPPPEKVVTKYSNTTSTSIPDWVWAVIGVVVVLAILGWALAVMRGGNNKGGSPPTEYTVPTSSTPDAGTPMGSDATTDSSLNPDSPGSGENDA